MHVVLFEVCQELTGEVGLGGELATAQQAPLGHPQPDFDLIEPTAVFGRVMDHAPMLGISEERPTLPAGAQTLRVKAHAGQPRDGAAEVHAPVRVQVVHDPREPLRVEELPRHVVHVPAEVPTGSPGQHIADHLPCRHDQTGDQAARAVANVRKRRDSELIVL